MFSGQMDPVQFVQQLSFSLSHSASFYQLFFIPTLPMVFLFYLGSTCSMLIIILIHLLLLHLLLSFFLPLSFFSFSTFLSCLCSSLSFSFSPCQTSSARPPSIPFLISQPSWIGYLLLLFLWSEECCSICPTTAVCTFSSPPNIFPPDIFSPDILCRNPVLLVRSHSNCTSWPLPFYILISFLLIFFFF